MRVEIDQDLCVGCGTCVDTCLEVFNWGGEEKVYSVVNEVPEDLEEQTRKAIESCPTDAINEY